MLVAPRKHGYGSGDASRDAHRTGINERPIVPFVYKGSCVDSYHNLYRLKKLVSFYCGIAIILAV